MVDQKMDVHASYQYLSGIYEAYRAHFEAAQERFPQSLKRLSQKDAFSGLSGLRLFAGIKGDILRSHDTITDDDTADAVHTINTSAHTPEIHDSYSYERMRTRHLLSSAIPRELLVERENLRQRGYIMLDHAQAASRHERTSFGQRLVKAAISDGKIYSDSYMSHIQKVFENSLQISEIQARKLELETPYDANLAEFCPGVTARQYQDIIESLFEQAVSARNAGLLAQEKSIKPIPLPDFTPSQGQKLVDLVCALLPIDQNPQTYKTFMLEGLPSLCMGRIATIRFSSNPLTLLETVFHERIGHLTYRANSDNSGGICGFHLDEARALSLERFFLRDQKVWNALSPLLTEAYGQEHKAFDHENLYRQTQWINTDLAARTSADDLTYIIQEMIRARAELYVMNRHFDIGDIPDFMAAETELALGLSDLNGYHICRETFQWPLAMQGHLAAYPTGLVLAAQLHQAALKACKKPYVDISKGSDSPYFNFMATKVDMHGTTKSPADIVKTATGQQFLDMSAIEDYLESKISSLKPTKPKATNAKKQKNLTPA